jgi:hypothetical protein
MREGHGQERDMSDHDNCETCWFGWVGAHDVVPLPTDKEEGDD